MKIAYQGARLSLITLVAAAVALGGATAAAAKVIRINVDDLAFDPANISAGIGDTIEWVNNDFVDHTATARNGQWDIALLAGGSGSMVVELSGGLEYFCRFHPHMMGTIHVEGP